MIACDFTVAMNQYRYTAQPRFHDHNRKAFVDRRLAEQVSRGVGVELLLTLPKADRYNIRMGRLWFTFPHEHQLPGGGFALLVLEIILDEQWNVFPFFQSPRVKQQRAFQVMMTG